MAAVTRWLPVALLIGAIGLVGWQQHTISELRSEVRAVGIRADSLEVELDTTRLMGDQYRRRALQAELEQDSLARELQERPVVTTTVVMSAEPVVDTVVAEVTDSTAYFKFDGEYVVAEVAIQLTPPLLSEWHVEVKPVKATVGVRCGPVSKTTGVRPVQVTVQAAPWEVDILDPQVDPKVCNPPPPPENRSFWKGFGAGALSVIALAFIL